MRCGVGRGGGGWNGWGEEERGTNILFLERRKKTWTKGNENKKINKKKGGKKR